nr:unnamed protein product [Callosobruchus chinensis]
MISLMYLILKLIGKHYEYIQVLLRNTLSTHSKKMVHKVFDDLSWYYLSCNNVIRRFNAVFSLATFLIIVNAYVSVLAYVMWCFEDKYINIGSFKGEKILIFFAQTASLLIYNSVLVISCDRVMKKKEQVTLLCYTLQIDTIDVYLHKQLNNFALITKKLSLEFTAGGFCIINQKFFSSFLATVASYCIICVQLYVSR